MNTCNKMTKSEEVDLSKENQKELKNSKCCFAL